MARFRYVWWMAIVVLAASLPAAAKDLAVVVNKSNETKTLTPAELGKILKNTTKKWSNGQEIVVILRDPGVPAMRVLLQKTLGMTPDQFKAMATAANQGRATPAFVFADSDDVVLKMVAASAGALGFIDVYSINSSVAVVKIDEKMPLESGYFLHGVW